jgi:two-component system, chemotaxis family, chemotaxis protein CheY
MLGMKREWVLDRVDKFHGKPMSRKSRDMGTHGLVSTETEFVGEEVMEQFAPIKRSKDGQPVRYLIVDDSVFARKNLGRIIESFGGQVAGEAGDGLTAISEYERIKPDIVLMDITMPQMEGIEAAEKIVQQNPDARVVMVSSVGYQENIVAALQRGARHFVQKPVKPEVLYEVIKYVLGEDGAMVSAAGAGA